MLEKENNKLAWKRFCENGRIEDYLKFKNINLDSLSNVTQEESLNASEYRRSGNQIN